MSAPIIWIIVPGVIALLILFLQRWLRISMIVGAISSLILFLLAWGLPIGVVITVGTRPLTILDTLSIFGRRLVIDNGDRPILTLIYLLATVWFLGALVAKPGRFFVPLGLGMVTLMVAFLVVEPFLYAALIIELASFICIPILSPPGKKPGRGVMRFLTFLTLGTPFILLAGWALNNLEANPNNVNLSLQALLFMALGFGFLLAVFPFNTWIPLLAEEAHPYAAGFVLCLVPGMVSLFGIGFIERYPWLYSSTIVFNLLCFIGAVMVVSGGVWAAFQTNLSRLMGYALIIDTGLAFFLVGCSQAIFQAGPTSTPQLPVFFALFLSRGLITAVWALSLSILRVKTSKLTYQAVRGFGRQLPMAGIGLILATFSMAGYPLLAGYPARQVVWNQIATTAPEYIVWSLVGAIGLLVGGLRSLAALMATTEDVKFHLGESRLERVFLGLAILLIFALGLFPQ